MSKIALSGNASGTGTLTIAAPNTNSDRTLTLPDNTGTLDTLQRAGNLLQVVQGIATTQLTSTTTTYADTGLTATITPTSATSKILVIVTQSFYRTGSTSGANIKLFRGATDLGLFVYNGGYSATTSTDLGTFAFQTLDTPNTTSPIAYKTQWANFVNASQVRVQPDAMPSHITLMEIAA